MTLFAVGLVVGLLGGGGLAGLMTWWSARRIEREAARQYELGVAEGLQSAQGRRRGTRRPAGDPASANARRRRRNALRAASTE
jgi:hypothetical protein